MTASILTLVLPVLCMLMLGRLCAARGIIGESAQEDIKNLMCNVLLPITLFRAFFTAPYDARLALVLGINFALAGLALAAGYALRPLVHPYGKYFPMLLTCMEGGMIGYSLYGVLTGGRLSAYAAVDIGQSLFIFTVYLSMIARENGARLSMGDMVRGALNNRCFRFILAGVALGALGVYGRIQDTAFWQVADSAMSFVTAPISGMILLVIGCQLRFERALLRPVIRTVAIRAVLNAALAAVGLLIIFALVPFDKELFFAMLVQYIVPTCFVLSVYVRGEADARYVSTALSVGTVAAALLFIPVAALYAVM